MSRAKATKYYYYVGVNTSDGMRLITGVNYNPKEAYWKKEDNPKELGKNQAEGIAMGLMVNGHWAVVIKSLVEIPKQIYIADEKEEK